MSISTWLDTAKKYVKDVLTEKDGESYCWGVLMAIPTEAAAIYKFLGMTQPDFVGLGACTAAVIAAVVAKKKYGEGDASTNTPS